MGLSTDMALLVEPGALQIYTEVEAWLVRPSQASKVLMEQVKSFVVFIMHRHVEDYLGVMVIRH